MRRLSLFTFCLLAAISLNDSGFAQGIFDEIRTERMQAERRARLTPRQLQRLERQEKLKEIERQKREAREAKRQERLKAAAEARAAREVALAEKLAAQRAEKAAKAAELAARKAAIEEAKEQARLQKEAERIAKERAEQTASLYDTPAEGAQAPDPQALQRQEWEDNLDGWIDTDEGTRPSPRQEVAFETKEAPGTIVIDTASRKLYYVLGSNRAIQYGIGVGRPGFEWMGVKSISRKEEWPDWRPPDMMIARRPDLPRYMPGGPTNPLGARAMYLGSTLYRIHGSNEPETIGQAVSSGCFRMVNADVIDLYNRTQLGAKVIVR